MLKQKELIANVKNLTESDERITACMMYGSFTKGEGDQYSDIEFYIFLKDSITSNFDSSNWLFIMGPLSRPRSKILRVAVSRIILSSEASKVKLVGNLVA